MRSAMLTLLLGAMMVGHAHSADGPLVCPLPTDLSDSLKYVSFFDGDPAEMVELAPEDASGAGSLDLTWQFSIKRDRPLNMVCSYRSAAQPQRIVVPDTISLCKLTGEIEESGTIKGTPILICQ